MCVLFVCVNRKPLTGQYKLILASNRDESFKRPAKSAEFWDNGSVLAGQDLTVGREGGTWLGASRNGRVAVLLNDARKEANADSLSRGPLVAGFLTSENPKKHLDNLLEIGEKYSPFQLATCDLLDDNVVLRHFSNLDKTVVEFEDGVYGFSNGSLPMPYKKASFGKERLASIVDRLGKTTTDKDTLVGELLSLLRNTETNMPDPNLEKLSNRPGSTNTALSAINVRLPEAYDFGTRTSTVILVDGNANVDFYEWQHNDSPASPNHFSFLINP